VIEPRIYRAAFLPALIVAVLLMFSFEERPPPVPQGLAADVLFDGRAALTGLREFVRAHPRREAGSPGDAAAGRSVARSLRANGFATGADRFDAEGRSLVNVVGTRPGASERRVVVMAARDAAHGADAAGSGADTAALLEMGRVFSGRATRKTIVLASVDGSSVGEAGARRFAETLEDPSSIDAVLVVSGLGAQRARGPTVVEWSNDATRASIGLQRTAAAALRLELGAPPGQEGALGQLIRLGLPLGVGAQGPLIERGLPAIRLSGSGELPPPDLPVAAVRVGRFGALGRTALRVVSAADAAPAAPRPGPRSYVLVARQVLPEWVVSALVLALILPALVASVDAFARARRRREPVGRWLVWTLAGAVPFVAALLAADALGLTGAGPEGSSPPPPGAGRVDAGALALLAGLAALVALVWVVGRSRLLRRAGRPFDPTAPGAACAIALIGSTLALLTWLVNPFAALLLLPSVHLWMLATASPRESGARDPAGGTQLRARRLRMLLALGGLAIPIGVVAFYLQRLALDPLDGLWYGFSLISGGHVATATALAGCLFLGLVPSVAMVLVAAARRRPPPPPSEAPKVSVRGPASYAGPGSLGGTESALRR
jgi:hypothetical protein